jgi:hypothetical protein
MLKRILEANFKRPPQFPFRNLTQLPLHFAISSLLGLGTRAIPLISVLMSTFQASFTDQGTPFNSNRFSEPALTVELNVL